MPTPSIQTELRRRAAHHLGQSHLAVDFNRIRRKFAFRLPVQSLSLPDQPIPGVPLYPWGIWLAWAMEERILSLGWCAQHFGDEPGRAAAAKDLEALAGWPLYRQFDFLDLGLAHNARILWTAATKWDWLEPALKESVAAALRRIVADGLPLHLAHYGEKATAEKILDGPDPVRALHNVSLIGSLGVAIAASVHPGDENASCLLNANLHAYVEALLTLREAGHTEGVSYDGYVHDLVCDWLTTLDSSRRASLMCDSRWSRYFEEALHIGAPGDLLQLAPLGDVESHKTFQASSQIKMHALQGALVERPYPRRAWYLDQLPPTALRTDALAALYEACPKPELQSPPAGIGSAHYALSLRTGWQPGDCAVVIAASNCVLAHLPPNYGSLCIGSEGRWFIQTPGYQQYMPTSEREWTNGPTSRNTPVFNGQATSLKNGRVVEVQEADESYRATLDLSSCYAPDASAGTVTRSVRLWTENGEARVLVEDSINRPGKAISEPKETTITYHWHADAEAAWLIEAGCAGLHIDGRTLWISSPNTEITYAHIHRLRGSRGPLALVRAVTPGQFEAGERIQWLFAFGDQPPAHFWKSND